MEYTVIITGDKNTGKTAFVDRLAYGEYRSAYTPTVGVKEDRIEFATNYDKLIINMRETVDETYFSSADGAIILYAAFGTVNEYEWARKISRVKNIPVMICGNKYDLMNDNGLRNVISCRNNIRLRDTIMCMATGKTT